jgi:hypothetical protein
VKLGYLGPDEAVLQPFLDSSGIDADGDAARAWWDFVAIAQPSEFEVALARATGEPRIYGALLSGGSTSLGGGGGGGPISHRPDTVRRFNS